MSWCGSGCAIRALSQCGLSSQYAYAAAAEAATMIISSDWLCLNASGEPAGRLESPASSAAGRRTAHFVHADPALHQVVMGCVLAVCRYVHYC